MMPGRALKVCVGGGGVESEFSDCFGYSFALAKPLKKREREREREREGGELPLIVATKFGLQCMGAVHPIRTDQH